MKGRRPDRVEYLRGIYLNMVPDQAKNPTLRVRLSRLGPDAQPAYRIECDDADGNTVVLGWYQGDKHKPLTKKLQESEESTWSRATTSYIELRTLHNREIGV
nr:hypothetical protein [Methylobacterium sp. 37f]